MQKLDVKSEESQIVANLFEQIVSVNKMIDLHTEDEFMSNQYKRRKAEFLEEFKIILDKNKINFKEIAA